MLAEELRTTQSINLNDVSEGEAILADRGCQKIMGMSLKELCNNYDKRGLKLPRHIWENCVLSGAVDCEQLGKEICHDENIKDKIILRIKCLESKLHDYQKSLNLLESRNNVFQWE
jgi:hypothetical protein